MKQVRIKQITMRNFRGEEARTTIFNETGATYIAGRNGIGKSRHFDAAIWLLFGKDAQDRKDFEIKTRVNGDELHHVETSVEGVFDVDGETITMKRAIIENWVKPRGTTDLVFKGNETKCFWNNAPVSVSEYTRRVDEIIDATLFKMLTNPAFFAGMKWQLQREQLMQMVGTITDDDIIAAHPEFAELLDAISGKTLSDYRREIAATKKRLQAELDQIQPRIDQTQRMMPEAVNVDELKQAIAQCDKEIAGIDKKISDATAAIRATYNAAQERAKQIGELKLRKQEKLSAMKAKAREKVVAANAGRTQVEAELRAHHSELTSLNITAKRLADLIAERQQSIANEESIRAGLLKEWHEIAASQYSGETTCPHCGQELPHEMQEQAKEMFNTDKATMLASITAKGQQSNARREQDEAELTRIQDEKNDIDTQIADTESIIAEKTQWLMDNPAILGVDNDPADTEEIKAINQRIADMESIIDDNGGISTDVLQQEKRAVMSRRDELRNELSQHDARERGIAEINRLKQSGQELAQQIADIERMQYMADEFTRERVRECENRINAMFTMVSFKMFDTTQDGNVYECCVPMVNGVPYPVANTAAKINAGLDIINALCRHYGITAPIFIDNAESINEQIPCESQVINLCVTDDETLVVR